jgi:DNA invertase Pin-like site-specific DNA recombinase
VSTDEQAKEGFSLDSQERRLRAYCEAQDPPWTPMKPVFCDPGHSGMDTDRPGYQAMLKYRDQWDACLAIKGDRFHRNVDNARKFVKDMRAAGKQIWSTAEDRIDKTENAAQWFTSMITTQLLPELESRQISERVLPAMEIAKEKGLHQGKPPVGFIWVKALAEFQPSRWGKKVKDDADRLGPEEAARMNTWPPDSKMAGRRLNRTTVWRIVKNFELYQNGQLLPNRRKTKSGTFSKFKDEQE